EWGPWSMKAGILCARAPGAALSQLIALRVHIDSSTATNGPLRVLPGTHNSGVLSAKAIARLARTIPPVACIAPRGSLVVMRPLIVHASSKSTSPVSRRVLHIEYARTLILQRGIELAVM